MGKTYVQGEVLNATDLNASFLELKTLPINPQTATYTLVVDDLGKVISAKGPVNIPANVFASGGTVSIFNNSTAVINIIQAAGLTLYNASTSVAGSFTLNSRGICSVIFVNTTTAVLTGVGVSVTASGTLQGPVGPAGSFATISAGSAAAPSIAPAADTNTGMFFPAADTIAFAEGGAEAMRINSSGNVGIGTTSPGNSLQVSRAGADVARFTNTQSNGGDWQFKIGGGGFEDRRLMITDKFSGADNVRVGIDSSGNFQFNSGYGSAAVAYGCRAWVNFNGTGVVAIRGSGNVTSITDNGVGSYTVNFTTAMPDTNYCTTGACEFVTLNTFNSYFAIEKSTVLVGSVKVRAGNSTTGAVDVDSVFAAIFR